MVECRDCHMVRLFPWPEPAELATCYPENYWFEPDDNAWRRFARRGHTDFVLRALDESSLALLPVLDVGCGAGLFLRELGLPANRLVGLDFSSSAASMAWQTNGVPAICGALPRAPFRPGSFAAITMFHVLEHLYDPVAYLQAARNLLHAEGRLIVQVTNASCWQFLVLGENWNGIDVPRHLITFKERDLRNLLEHCGFDIVRTRHFSLRDNPSGLATSLAPALDPKARGVRGLRETPFVKKVKDGLHLLLTLASIPFAWMEAVCGAGSTVTIEARPRAR